MGVKKSIGVRLWPETLPTGPGRMTILPWQLPKSMIVPGSANLRFSVSVGLGTDVEEALTAPAWIDSALAWPNTKSITRHRRGGIRECPWQIGSFAFIHLKRRGGCSSDEMTHVRIGQDVWPSTLIPTRSPETRGRTLQLPTALGKELGASGSPW